MRVIIIQTRHSSSVANSNVYGEPENENKLMPQKTDGSESVGICIRNIKQVVAAVWEYEELRVCIYRRAALLVKKQIVKIWGLQAKARH